MREEQRDKELFPGFLVAGLIVLVNVYFYALPFFSSIGLTHEVTRTAMRALYMSGLFGSEVQSLVSKLLALGLVFLVFIIANGFDTGMPWSKCLIITGIGITLFLLPCSWVGYFPYVLTTFTGFFVSIYGIKRIALKLSALGGQPRQPNETFQQNEQLVNTPYSFNLKMRYYWKQSWHWGYVNIVEPFRHIFISGGPGSGKTASLIEQQLVQNAQKGFAMFVYDYKFPELSTMVYHSWLMNRNVYKEKYGYDENFLVINFSDPRYSDRCNPLDPMYIRTLADAQEAALTIMSDLIPNKNQSNDTFFGPSAEVYLAGLIMMLRTHENGKYCTFPHLIELVSCDYKKVLAYAKQNSMLRKLFSAFIDADTPKSQGQIQGQIASARIPLMKMMDPFLYWVMSANDVPLDLNNIEAPKVMCIGNVPSKIKITSTAISLIAARMFKEVNTKEGAPLNINIDECTTFHATGMDSTMATCRSKKIGFTIAVQDPNQMFRDWGEKEAKAILGNLSNQFYGQSLSEYTRHVSDLLGKEFRLHKSVTNGDSDSVNSSYQLEDKAPVSAFANLSQGEFIGFVADDDDHPSTLKQFHCKIKLDVKKRNEIKHYTDGIPKSQNMMPFFNDELVASQVREHPDEAILEHFLKVFNAIEDDREKRKKDYHRIHEEVLEKNAQKKLKKLSEKARERVITEIIEEKQVSDMLRILNENEEKIRAEAESVLTQFAGVEDSGTFAGALPSNEQTGNYNG